MSLKHGLTTPAEAEAEVARLMIEQTSGDVIITADHSKIGAVFKLFNLGNRQGRFYCNRSKSRRTDRF